MASRVPPDGHRQRKSLSQFELHMLNFVGFTATMSSDIILKTQVRIGVVPTHLRFVGCLLPGENGRYPRNEDGVLKVISGMRELCEQSPVKMDIVQISYFSSADPADVAEMVDGLRALDLEVHFIFMIGGANPMNPADEDAVAAQLVPAVQAAIRHGIRHVSSTSIEEWMNADHTREGAEFDAAIAQNVKLHLRVYEETGIAGSCVENWDIEFLRPGEFKTFTNLDRAWSFVKAANRELGGKFFKLLVDAAHCGDSGLTIPENEALIARIAAAGELGAFHASAKTTRGCLSTDDGWIGALLAAVAKTGTLRHVFVEVFHHADDALEPLRKLEPGHGVDTRDGRTYTELMADGLRDVSRRINNLAARGILPS